MKTTYGQILAEILAHEFDAGVLCSITEFTESSARLLREQARAAEDASAKAEGFVTDADAFLQLSLCLKAVTAVTNTHAS
jgi:hypothetical protein